MKRIALIVVTAFILLAGCVQEPATQGPGGTQNSPGATGEVKSFEIVARQFEFEPSVITVNQGDTVNLTIRSVDVEHGFALPGFGIDEKLSPGQEVKVSFVAGKKGTFSFFCNVFCGSGHSGMNGQLVVE